MKEKITKVLEKAPAGLSISEIAEKAGLHRNTVSNLIADLMEEDIVRMRKLGNAKVFYLTKYAGLHEHELGYKGENISVGLGVSDLEDGYKAAVSASKQAVNQACPGEEPSFSLVFVSSRYNEQIEEVVKALNSILGENWIGCTTDREINSILGYCEGTINVLAIKTKYMHFGIGISEDYRRNPVEEGKKATIQAIENCPVDRSKFATMEFMRGTRNHFREIVRQPPYFVLTLIGGTYYENKRPIPGMESEFLEGIKSVVGPFLPIAGASASSDIEKMLEFEGKNYVFGKGNFYNRGAVVCFIVSELSFIYGFSHPYVSTEIYGTVTKISENKKIIEINNRPSQEEYKRLVSKVKDKFSIEEVFEKIFARKYKDILVFLKYPALYKDVYGNTYPLAFRPEPEGKILVSPQKISENTNFAIGKYDKKKAVEETPSMIKSIIEEKHNMNPVFGLIFSCAARCFLLYKTGKIEKFMENLNNVLNTYVGFSANGEIGGTKEFRFVGFSDIFLIFFDRTIIE